jgi:N-acetylmuramic acid 6-phosphate etherase
MHLIRTEDRNPRTRDLDQLPTRRILELINDEDQTIALRVREKIGDIERAVDVIVDRLQAGGRLIYVGAGTSARLAVADAAELTPTYGIPPTRVPVIVAGGSTAVLQARENAEDCGEEAVRELERLGVSQVDTVLGLSANGHTPFVRKALSHAKSQQAATILITCNEVPADDVDVLISVVTGPEVVTGSTRMKAGTAQRMILTMLSTTVAVRLGLVYDNLMVAMASRNKKCDARSVSTVQAICGVGPDEAARALEAAGWDIRTAVIMIKKGMEAAAARRLLHECRGVLRKALTS